MVNNKTLNLTEIDRYSKRSFIEPLKLTQCHTIQIQLTCTSKHFEYMHPIT
jgi:hypothetical protein